MTRKLHIGITCGDVNGIGPEIAQKAVMSPHWEKAVKFTFIGPNTLPFLKKTNNSGGQGFSEIWTIPFNDELRPGSITANASITAVLAIKRAVRGCLDGKLDAMVTAPICKEGLKLADIPYPGHTEMIAKLTGTKRYGMMLMGKGLRVMLATRHLPLRQVPDALTEKKIKEAIELTGEALQFFGYKNGRIGVCGLNPHAGDGGVLGNEEFKKIAPAIQAAQKNGLNAVGPIPADVIFFQTLKNQYDAVVAMYHDQGLAPLKMHAFDCGVNLTLGLPILRTSPDHGTAFNIAGKEIASANSMIAAIQTAFELAQRHNPWTS